MSKRVITISREFGSGGRTIAFELAERLGYNFYDKALVERINATADWDKDIEGQFKAGIEKFKATQTW